MYDVWWPKHLPLGHTHARCAVLLLFCVYLDCQIARPSFLVGATLCCDWTIRSLCGFIREVSSLCSLFCWLCLLGLYGRCRIYWSYLPLLCCLYGFLYIPQVYVLVFRLVHHICGRLSCCVYLCSCFFTSSILVRALNMVEASILVSLFMYVFLLQVSMLCCLVDIVFWFFLLLLRSSCQQIWF